MTIDEMPAGREITALIAEKVMSLGREIRLRGETSTVTIYSDNPWWQDGAQTQADVVMYGGPKPYSTDIAAAWEVTEKMRAANWHIELSTCAEMKGPWYCHFQEATLAYAYASTAPLAICRAALKAVTP